MNFKWVCPYCTPHVTITGSNLSKDNHMLDKNHKNGHLICNMTKWKNYE